MNKYYSSWRTENCQIVVLRQFHKCDTSGAVENLCIANRIMVYFYQMFTILFVYLCNKFHKYSLLNLMTFSFQSPIVSVTDTKLHIRTQFPIHTRPAWGLDMAQAILIAMRHLG